MTAWRLLRSQHLTGELRSVVQDDGYRQALHLLESIKHLLDS